MKYLVGIVFASFIFAAGCSPEASDQSKAESKPHSYQKSTIASPASAVTPAVVFELRELLVQQNFDELNARLSSYYRNYEQSRNELSLIDAYRAFEWAEKEHEALLLNWIEQKPETPHPHLAIAQYYYSRGFAERGGSFFHKVSGNGGKEFKLNLKRSATHLRKAIELDDRLLPAYITLIDIERSTGKKRSAITTEAFERFPNSLELRMAEIRKHQPRWGGNYRKMNKFATATIEASAEYPVMNVLAGMANEDKSSRHYSNEKYIKSLKAANDALSFGENYRFYIRKARANVQLENLDSALRDINKAISLRPTAEDNFYVRASLQFRKHNVSEAVDDLALYVKLWPEKKKRADKLSDHWLSVFSYRAYENYQTDTRQAISLFDKALAIDENHHYSAYWRAMALARVGSFDKAIEGMHQSIEIDPKDFESYRQLDYLLARDKQWNKIISNWNAFLRRVPDHADAYLERAGTHYHNGDQKQSLKDLRRACELGSKEACGRIR